MLAARVGTARAALAPRRRLSLITTPIYYVNGAPHLGHAYSSILADALSRFEALRGAQTLFSTGTDEHGLKVQDAAARQGLTPQALCDATSDQFRSLFTHLDVGYDRFIRTTDPDHAEAVRMMWCRLRDRGHIYLGTYAGWYCKSDEAFVPAPQVRETRGDDGSMHMVTADSGHAVEWVEEENYLFALSALADDVEAWLRSSPAPVTPEEHRTTVLRHLEGGLADLSVSRPSARIQWGIPVPEHPEQTIYVWLDALTNYLTVAGLGGGRGWEGVAGWPAHTHVIGMDIAKFHCVYWPAFLLAAGLPPPERVLVHSHWVVEGVKMSKSLGNVVDPTREADRFGVDRFRYFLLRRGGLAHNGTYAPDDVVATCNAELTNTWANLASRATTLSLFKHATAAVDALGDGWVRVQPLRPTDADRRARDELREAECAVRAAYEGGDVREALERVMGSLRAVNAYFNECEPWKLKPEPGLSEGEVATRAERLATILHTCMDALTFAGTALQPAVPQTAKRLLQQLGVGAITWADMAARVGADVSDARPHTFRPTKRFALVDRLSAP